MCFSLYRRCRDVTWSPDGENGLPRQVSIFSRDTRSDSWKTSMTTATKTTKTWPLSSTSSFISAAPRWTSLFVCYFAKAHTLCATLTSSKVHHILFSSSPNLAINLVIVLVYEDDVFRSMVLFFHCVPLLWSCTGNLHRDCVSLLARYFQTNSW